MFILSWVLYCFFVYAVNYFPVFNSFATMSVAFESAGLYLNWILIVGVTFIIDFSFYLYNYFFKGNLVNILMQEKKRKDFKTLAKI